MACGAPVITSDAASMPEVAGDAACLVDPHDPDDLAVTLWRILQHSEMQTGLRTRGLDRAARFSWTAATERLLPLYHSVACTALSA
jgi:glycosyltransferase involved in cell wall biosynthesis